MEIWKPIAGFEGLYEVSNMGKVKSLLKIRKTGRMGTTLRVYPERILKTSKSPNGYIIASLCKYGKMHYFTVHRLVALAFLENKNNKDCINHMDCNKENNSVNNLEWCTRSENSIHAGKNGRQKTWFTSENQPKRNAKFI